MRIDRFLANSGVGTRREIKDIIRKKCITVAGSVITSPSFAVDKNSPDVFVSGKNVRYKEFVYLMLNKPAGYVSAVFDKRLPVVTDLVPAEFAHYEVFPVGRLDIDTEGLLLLTNDGDLTHRLLSPKYHVDKQYFVRCEKEIDLSCEQIFADGVTLDDGYKTMSADIVFLGGAECLLTIREGKYHQVKRMFEAVGNKVTYLKRVKMGEIALDDNLKCGEVRELSSEELKLLLGE